MVFARCKEGLEGTQAQDLSLAIPPLTLQHAHATMLLQFLNLCKQSPQAKPCQKYQLDSGCAIAVSSYQQVTFIILGIWLAISWCLHIVGSGLSGYSV